jgi:hypothetical protein
MPAFKKEIKDLIQNIYDGYDPIVALVDIGLNPTVDVGIRVACHKEVAKYFHAPMRSKEESYSKSEDNQITGIHFQIIGQNGSTLPH